jgi:hypoxanthine phosphoribosyltransferase
LNSMNLDANLSGSTMPEHLHSSYNDIHHLVRNASTRIAAEFQPNLLIVTMQ